MLNNYEDNYTNYFEDTYDFEDTYGFEDTGDTTLYDCNESDKFQINAVIAKKNEAELVSLMILGFFIIFNTLLYKSVNKIISAQRERLVKYQLISEYYMNQYGVPLTCPIKPSLNLEDPDAILKHIIKTETKESNPVSVKLMRQQDGTCGVAAEDNHRILRSQKKSLGIKGNGWKLD